MGDAGWIAVDATANEIDFVDAGHIRLGELSSFLPQEMEILEYRLENTDGNTISRIVPESYNDLIGEYTLLENNKIFTVLFQDGSLAVTYRIRWSYRSRRPMKTEYTIPA